MTDNKAIFEFTRDGQRFEIFERGYVRVTPSTLPHEAAVIINRIPRRIMEAERAGTTSHAI